LVKITSSFEKININSFQPTWQKTTIQNLTQNWVRKPPTINPNQKWIAPFTSRTYSKTTSQSKQNSLNLMEPRFQSKFEATKQETWKPASSH
jgi:hypothetical protein